MYRETVPTFARFGRLRAAVLPFALLSIGLAYAPAWKDPSKHIERFIQTGSGVKLEVLDWGGRGQPVLLLAGHGDTGHIFDDFAPDLTSSFHVLAITRRGFGASSQPKQGYDLTTMVRDIARVSDALHLKQVDLVAHSIAGDEVTRFALTYPDRVRKLVYLEAAYDRVDEQRLESKFPKIPPAPSEDRESGSPAAIRALIARTEILMPEAEIRATRIFGANGQLVRPVTPEPILHAVAAMVDHPNYRSISAPILAIYAVYETPGTAHCSVQHRRSGDSTGTRPSLRDVAAICKKPTSLSSKERASSPYS